MTCELDYWTGFWLGTFLALVIVTLIYIGLHHVTKD